MAALTAIVSNTEESETFAIQVYKGRPQLTFQGVCKCFTMADEVLTEGVNLLPIGGSFVNLKLRSLLYNRQIRRNFGDLLGVWSLVDGQ